MLKKIFSLFAFLMAVAIFSTTSADMPDPGRDVVRASKGISISIQKFDGQNSRLTLKIHRRDKNITKYTYTVEDFLNETVMTGGDGIFENDDNSVITFQYPENGSDIPDSLTLKIETVEDRVVTPYGIKRLATQRTKNYSYIIEFARDAEGNLTAALFE